MAITFQCTCGRTLRVNDNLAGKKARCPQCQGVVVIPQAEDPGFEVIEDDPPAPAPRRASPVQARAIAPPPAADFEVVDDDPPPPKSLKPSKRRAVLDEDEDEDEPRSRRNKRRYEDDDDEDDTPKRNRKRYEEDDDEDDEDERPRKRKKSRSRKQSSGGINTGALLGGIVATLFFGGLAVLNYFSDHPRANGRMIGCAVFAIFCLVGVGRTLMGGGDDE